MRHEFESKYVDLDSAVHKLDHRVKLVCILIFVVMVAVSQSFTRLAAYSTILLALLLVSKVPLGYFLRRTAIIAPFVGTIAILIIFVKSGAPIASLNLGPLSLSITAEGLEFAGLLVFRAFIAVGAIMLLTCTTRFNDLLRAMRDLKAPKLLVAVLAQTYRYIFLLADELMRVRRARDSRAIGRHGRWRWLRTLGNMTGGILIRSYERAERVYSAMLARGYSGEVKVLGGKSLQPLHLSVGIAFSIGVLVIGWLL
jgi:cobalt/nickel transport system permease protein